VLFTFGTTLVVTFGDFLSSGLVVQLLEVALSPAQRPKIPVGYRWGREFLVPTPGGAFVRSQNLLVLVHFCGMDSC